MDWISFGFFWMVLMTSLPVLIYGVGYGGHYTEKRQRIFLNLTTLFFVLSMLGVVLAPNMILFLVAWELMALSSMLLVFFEDESIERIRHGILYGVMTHLSGIFVLASFLYLYHLTGEYDFYTLGTYKTLLSDSQIKGVLALAFIGFSIKGGMVPAHVWLPKAHPAAPSSVSALMSGVMIKIAIYGLIRMTYGVFGAVPLSIALTVFIVGMLTAMFGVLYGLYQNQIKVFLAYSSVENMGIMFMVLGASFIFGHYGLHRLQELALLALLLHVLNHAFFKSLLFMVAGAVYFATGEKNASRLGGLAKQMPMVALFALIGCLAVSAVPPLNGFASELLIFMSLIQGMHEVANLTVTLWLMAGVIVLGLCSGAVLYMMVKGFGTTFLGAPRVERENDIQPLPKTMYLGMALTAGLVVLSGVFAPWVIQWVTPVAKGILETQGNRVANGLTLAYLPHQYTVLALVVCILSGALYSVANRNDKRSTSEIKGTWGCGFNTYQSHMQYTPDAITQPSGKFLSHLTGYRLHTKRHTGSQQSVHFNYSTKDYLESHAYKWFAKGIDLLSHWIVKLQYGYVQVYVLYIMIALAMTLWVVIKWL